MRCPGGVSGHETDKVSEWSPANLHVLAKGTNPDEGGAEMVFFETLSGGAVFSAGSISYASAAVVDSQVPHHSQRAESLSQVVVKALLPALLDIPVLESRTSVSFQ